MNILSSIYHAALDRPPAHIPSPMELLPQDILVLILQSIESLRSLRAAVVASSAFNDAFRTAKIETLSKVVSRSRPKEVHGDAVALSVLMQIRHGPTTMTVKALLDNNLQRAQQEWLFLRQGLSSPQLLRFHWYVEYFTEKLFKASMRHIHQKGWTGSARLRFRRLSNTENVRIHRALYRLELFSSYVEMDPKNYGQLTASIYWKEHVSVWEMEEIACVQNLIFHRLATIDHVIQSLLRYMGVIPSKEIHPQSTRIKLWVEEVTKNAKSLLLCLSLSTLFRILTEPDKQSTRRLIHEMIQGACLVGPNPVRIDYLSRERSKAPIPLFMFAGRETEQPCTLHLDRLRIWKESPEYPSYGYARTYRSTTLSLVKSGHMNRKESSLYNESKHHEDRKWGYCLWDKERMEFGGNEFADSVPRSQLRVTSHGSPGWTTTRLN